MPQDDSCEKMSDPNRLKGNARLPPCPLPSKQGCREGVDCPAQAASAVPIATSDSHDPPLSGRDHCSTLDVEGSGAFPALCTRRVQRCLRPAMSDRAYHRGQAGLRSEGCPYGLTRVNGHAP